MAPPMDAEGRWRRHATRIVALSWLLGLSTILPWFARNTILPADDGHLEILNAWTNGQAVAAAGDGWAGPLRVVPWGALFVAVAGAGVICATLAKRRAPSDPAARLPVLVCIGAGYVFGRNEFVKKNFELVIIMIILISVLPMVFEVIKARREAKSRDAAHT